MGGEQNQNQRGQGPGVPSAQPGFTPLFVAPTPEELNRRLPQFEILQLIGQGGMGAVYKARQPRLDRFVAIKLLPPLLDDDIHSFGERFEREARAMAQLNHQNIVTVHDFGETEDGLRYIVMEYVDGTDLHAAIASRKVTAAHVLSWAPQICAALSYAHSQNLVHRDIKPANILISREGQVKVGDFGLAKLVGASRDLSLTQSQVSMGTPDYAAPEAMRAGASVDQRADLYSFGVVLYEMLTGVVPRGAWKAPSMLCPVDPRLDKIVIKAMQPDPTHRYQRMAQIAEALDEVKRNPTPAAADPVLRAIPVGAPVPVRKRMHPAAVALIALASVAVAVGGILFGTTYFLRDSDGAFALSVGRLPAEPPLPSQEPVPSVPPKMPDRPVPVPPRPPVLPSPEKQRPPDLKAGWVSLQPASGGDVDATGPGWVTSLDDLVYNGKGKDRYGSRVFLAPPPPTIDYEFRLEVVDGGLAHPLAIRLPIGQDSAHALFGVSAPGGGKERFAGLALQASPDPGHPGNRSRRQLEDPKGESSRIVLRVVRKGERTGIEATVNGQLALSWSGDPSELAPNDWFRGAGSKKLIALAASHPLSLHGIDCRAVPPGTWLVHEEPPESLALLTKAGESAAAPPLSGSTVIPSPAPVVETPLAKLENRFLELRVRYEGVENEVARAGFDRSMANLRESYQAALNRTMAEGGSLAVTAAVQRELIRIRDKEPLEDTDPPEMPETVKRMREVYRSSVKTFSSELNLATAPILREHMAALQAMAADPAWPAELPSAGKLIAAESARVESRLREILASAIPPARVDASPSSSPDAPLLSRPPFPPVRPQIKGSLVLVPRTRDGIIDEKMSKIPGGLSGSVVDVAVGESMVLALKSNGRVSLWGPAVPDVIRDELELIDGVSRVALAQKGKFAQIALLLENGKIETRAVGTSTSGLAELGEETEGFENLVDLAVTPLGGVGLDREGKLRPWGVFAAFPGMPENVMQVRPAGVGIVALGANGIPVYLTASPLPPGLPVGQPVLDIQFGAQEEPGAIVRTPEGKLQAGGSFVSLARELEALTKTTVVRRIEAGDAGVAVQTLENEWRFLGGGFHAGLEKSFAGCARVLISKTFIAGLLPQ